MKEKIKVAVEEYLGNKDNIAKAMAGCPVLSSIKKRANDAAGDEDGKYQPLYLKFYIKKTVSSVEEAVRREISSALSGHMRCLEHDLISKDIVGTINNGEIPLPTEWARCFFYEMSINVPELDEPLTITNVDYGAGKLYVDYVGEPIEVTLEPARLLSVADVDDLGSVELVFKGDNLVNLLQIRDIELLDTRKDYWGVTLGTEVALVERDNQDS